MIIDGWLVIYYDSLTSSPVGWRQIFLCSVHLITNKSHESFT